MKTLNILMMGNKLRGKYGYLYNYYAVSNANFFPSGWSLITPTVAADMEGATYDWTTFFQSLGGTRNSASGVFELKDLDNVIYTSNPFGDGFIWYGDTFGLAPNVYPFGDEKDGASVRPYYSGGGTPSATMTDYDGNVYDVVQVGSYYYTKQNWKCTRLNNGTSIPNVTDGTTWAGLTTLARAAYDNDINNV